MSCCQRAGGRAWRRRPAWRIDAGRIDGSAHVAREVGVRELARRHTLTLICSFGEPVSTCQRRSCLQAVSRTQRPISTIVPLVSASGMKSVRRQASARRVLPADQRFDADDPLGVELDQRLVLEEQLVALQRQTERGAELDALEELRAHRRLEARHPALARIL